jgi:hypothetical protein
MKKVTWASLVSSSKAPQSKPKPQSKPQPKQGGNKMLYCQAAGCKFKTGGPSGMGSHYKENPSHRPLYKQREIAKKSGGLQLGTGRIKCKGTLPTGQRCTFSTDNNQEMGIHYTSFPNHRKNTHPKIKERKTTKEVTKAMTKEGVLRRSALADLSGGPSVFEKLGYFRSDFILEIKTKEKIIVQLRDQLEKAEHEMKTLMAGLEVLNATISAKNPQQQPQEQTEQPQQPQQHHDEQRDQQDYVDA